MALNKAIVLAAGVGSRLRPLTDDRPKCLLEVGGRTILDRQLDDLRHCGVTEVVAVVGYCSEQIRARYGDSVRYVANERYEQTNSLYSLWLARQELMSGALILNSDVLAPRRLFERLLAASAPDAILVELGNAFEPEDMKVRLNGRRVVDFGKRLPQEQSHAHNVGVAKFCTEGARHLGECLERLITTGHENDWAPAAFREFAAKWPLTAVDTDGLPWIEIDFVEDLTRARVDIEPTFLAIENTVCS
ncbi:MAG: NTP transferase domain-containing protein [Gemmatimonadota bacterium]